MSWPRATVTTAESKRRRSVALVAFAMIEANGGITSATSDMMTAPMVVYLSTTAQAMTNRPMHTPIIRK